MRAHRLCAVAILALVLGGASAEEEEWRRPYHAHLPGLEPEDENGNLTVVSLRLVRVVESGLLEFIPHGTASFHTEETGPCAAGARLVARGEGDEFGFVNVRPPAGGWGLGAHWHFEAPGHGAAHDFRNPVGFEDVTLPGGIDRQIRVIDPFGEPLAGAKVSMFLGCPHSPALRSGVADEHGTVRFANLPADRTGDFWIEAPGVDCGPYDLEPAWVGQGGDTILTDPARTARGVVVDERGAPQAGVTVRETDYPRGPKAVTDERGRFVLHGVEWGRALYLYRPGAVWGARPNSIVGDFEEDVPLRVTLRAGRPTAQGAGESHHVVDVVAVRKQIWVDDGKQEERTVEEQGGVPVVLTRLSDGLTVRGTVNEGVFRALVPPGRYRVTAGGGFSTWRASRVETDLPRPNAEAVRVRVEWGQWSLSIDWTEAGGGGAHAELRIPGRKKQLGYRQNHSVHAPPDVKTGLFVSPPARILPFRDGAVAVVAPPKNRIRFRVVDPSGDPVDPGEVMIAWDEITPEKRDDGSDEICTWESGRQILSFGGFFCFWKRVAVVLPSKEAGVVDLGTIVRPGGGEQVPRRIRLRYASGEPVVGSEALTCLIREIGGPDPEWEQVEPDEGGVFDVEQGRGPLRLLVDGTGMQPFAARIPPGDRAEVRLPAGWITGEIHDPDGGLLPGIAYVDATRYECPDGRFAVRGVAAGPHLVIVGAMGHVGEARRIVLAEGERRDLLLDLPRR